MAEYEKLPRTPQGKCAECGKPLRPNVYTDYEPVEVEVEIPGYGPLMPAETRTETRHVPVGETLGGYGYMSQGYFCTLRCGWRFGLRVLKHDDQRRADKGER